MWSSEALGRGTFTSNGFVLDVDANSRSGELAMRFPGRLGLTIGADAQEPFPQVDEQFVCDDQFHTQHPQGECRYAFRFACDRIPHDGDVQIFETRLSIQTSLLDSHPAVRMSAGSGAPIGTSHSDPSKNQADPSNNQADPSKNQADPSKNQADPSKNQADPFKHPLDAMAGVRVMDSPILGVPMVLEHANHRLAVLLCREDIQACVAGTTATASLRFFGDFLEKGVICRVRPWLVYAAPGVSWDLAGLVRMLDESPVPLSA
ncbi:MAG: hypothetical protein AAF958_05830 [Planctomycetota bacterium]